MNDALLSITFGVEVEVTYNNWRGEIRRRKIKPLSLWYGTSPYHPDAQWLLEATDCEDQEVKTFSLTGITP